MKLYDRVKKMKNKLTVGTKSEATDNKKGNPEDHFIEDKDGQEHVFVQTHDKSITMQSADPDAQISGDYEKAVKKIDKKAKPSFTDMSMVAAQAGVEGEKYNKENPPDGDMSVQKPKLAKADAPPPPPPPPSGPNLDAGKVNAFTAGFLGKSKPEKVKCMRKCYANLKTAEKLEKGDVVDIKKNVKPTAESEKVRQEKIHNEFMNRFNRVAQPQKTTETPAKDQQKDTSSARLLEKGDLVSMTAKLQQKKEDDITKKQSERAKNKASPSNVGVHEPVPGFKPKGKSWAGSHVHGAKLARDPDKSVLKWHNRERIAKMREASAKEIHKKKLQELQDMPKPKLD